MDEDVFFLRKVFKNLFIQNNFIFNNFFIGILYENIILEINNTELKDFRYIYKIVF